MKKQFKSFAAVLLIFTILISLLPTAVMGADTITAYVSVIRNGEFTIGKNNATIAHIPVEISSQNPTIDEAFTALHETYYPDGVSGYRATQMPSYISITKFWGIESEFVGYCLNNNFAGGLNDPVNDGAHIVLWFYQASNWSDAYTYFDKTTATVTSDDSLNLTLYSGNSPLSDARITVDGIEISGVITDDEGKASLSFEEGGTYIVSAEYAESYIVPPVCIVTVIEEGKTDAEYIDNDKNALSVTYNGGEKITLPQNGNSGKTRIEWTSDSACVDTDTGVVTIPDEDTTVTLTATIWCNDISDTKEFPPINIPGRLSMAKKTVENKKLQAMEYTNATEWGYEYNSELDDTNILELVREAINDNDITVEFDDSFVATDIIAADGTITYPREETKEFTLPFLLNFKGQSKQVYVNVVIPKRAQTKAEAIDAMKAAMITYMNDSKVLNGNRHILR